MNSTPTTNPATEPAEPEPLFAFAADNAASRLALLKSLTPTATGLTLKRHNALVRTLSMIAADAMSDGTETEARARILARSAGRSRSTVYRILADASALGLITTEQRVGAVGQTISSRRAIVWQRVRELVGAARVEAIATRSAANGTRAPQVGHGRPKWDTGAPSGTPKYPYSSNNQDTTKTSGRPDVVKVESTEGRHDRRHTTAAHLPAAHTVPASAIAAEVDRLYAAIGYTGDEGQTLWAAVAAKTAGLIDEASLSRAIGRASGRRCPVAYFRTTLAEGLGMDLTALTATLRRVRVTPRLPGSRPASAQAQAMAASVSPFRRTVDDSQARADHRRRAILRELRVLADPSEVIA